jgi:ribosomal protein S18 acetylase RimI-like enzyme
MMYVESISSEERDSLLSIAINTGLFTVEEAESMLGGIIDGFGSRDMPEGHQAFCCRLNSVEPPVGWAYLAPDPHASGIWNLWWIGVSPVEHGTGAGKLLLRHAENLVAQCEGRLLIIETSDTEPLTRARRFYESQGYMECGRIPDFYAPGDGKVIFARQPRCS